jgi:LmbE family N-acetylglucosaminyl deacetylase
MNLARRYIVAAVLIAVCTPVVTSAQGVGNGTGGIARLAEEQRRIGNWRRVLMIGAHPDDEDTELLTILSRGMAVETAYLSLTRGDGGQNLIGPELGTALGVLRSEELLAARRIDGGRQFFSRAIDFGYTKTVDETFGFWQRDSLLKDAVRIIRRFRPQVIVSVWSGTPADGHGQHQASGVLALDAFRAAGDSTRFAELLPEEGLQPWTVAKFYRSARGPSANPTPIPTPASTLALDGGALDPVLGLSYHQIAIRSRDQHRSQNQGNLENMGPSTARVRLVERAAAITGADDSLFAGVGAEPAPGEDAHRDAARLIESGIVLDATTDDDEVVPGQSVVVTLSVWNAGRDTVFAGARLADCPFPKGCHQKVFAALTAVAPNTVFSQKVTAVAGEVLSTPYYLRASPHGAMYEWGDDAEVRGEPFGPTPFAAEFVVKSRSGVEIGAVREVQARSLDPVLGEVRKRVTVVPRIAVTLTPDRLLWPRSTTHHPFRVSLEHLARDSSDVTVSLVLPPSWKAGPSQHVRFIREGERATVDFTVTAPPATPTGEYDISALVVRGTDTLTHGLYRVRYPHVDARNILTTAKTKVVIADVKLPSVGTIGYVRGGGDLVPEALLSSGLPVRLLTGEALERGSLDGFKVILIGPRAYEFDESLRRANPRLMRWLEAGGTLLVQFQQSPYLRGGFSPRPFTLNAPADRTTDEHALVALLAPTHPALRSPNLITARDFEGWIQERGLYFARSWDAAWTPLLETHDAGDEPRAGSLLVARVGRGTVVYTGLAFFRQLPASVPGAWRLFANLLAVGQSPLAH